MYVCIQIYNMCVYVYIYIYINYIYMRLCVCVWIYVRCVTESFKRSLPVIFECKYKGVGERK